MKRRQSKGIEPVFRPKELPGAVAFEHRRAQLYAGVRAAIRRGRIKEAVRLTEALRQMVKARRAQRQALRRMQLSLFQR